MALTLNDPEDASFRKKILVESQFNNQNVLDGMFRARGLPLESVPFAAYSNQPSVCIRVSTLTKWVLYAQYIPRNDEIFNQAQSVSAGPGAPGGAGQAGAPRSGANYRAHHIPNQVLSDLSDVLPETEDALFIGPRSTIGVPVMVWLKTIDLSKPIVRQQLIDLAGRGDGKVGVIEGISFKFIWRKLLFCSSEGNC